MNIKLILLLIFIPFFAISHEVNIEDKSVEEVVKKRMGNMSKIKAYSSKMYPLTMTGEFDEIKLVNKELLHAAKDFKELFPEGSQGGKASDLIWEDRETFNLYNDNFIKSIEDIAISIENEDSVSLMENFNIMASNCGTCHKKFRN
ncbi:cytochrome c [Alphaproteobacteria bacterium]|nr:cytochrome c [Alphaproteobacteria bacterium]